jgi:methyltransferase (TIGR00027 family)
MQHETASRTALATAYLRAAHQLLDDPPLLLNDPIAVPLLGVDATGRICGSQARYQSAEVKSLRTHVVLRARFAEDRLKNAVARGVIRYVLIGAGFDTFALRQPAWGRSLRIVEIDHPSTQAAKRQRIAQAGLSAPENLRFIPIDFERDSLGEALARDGIGKDEPAFFSWLGVTVYLEEAAIDTTLRSMTSFAPGTEVVLTFRQPSNNPSSLAARTAQVGEPFVSLFTPDQIAAKLQRAGFSAVEFLTPEKARVLYFTSARNDLEPPKRTSILSASVDTCVN